jgi:hypothetical protein
MMVDRQEATNDLVQMAKENDGKLVDLLEAVTLINEIYDSRGICLECCLRYENSSCPMAVHTDAYGWTYESKDNGYCHKFMSHSCR